MKVVVSWPNQCCGGYCVPAVGVHNAEDVEAEHTAKLVARLIAEAEERGAARVRERVEGVAVRFDTFSDSTISADDRLLHAAVAVEIRAALGGDS